MPDGRPSPLFELNVSTIHPADFHGASVSGDNKAQLLRLKEARDATFANRFVSEPPLWRYL
jgi:hypothetical protein